MIIKFKCKTTGRGIFTPDFSAKQHIEGGYANLGRLTTTEISSTVALEGAGRLLLIYPTILKSSASAFVRSHCGR
jgi:hypothetical protein